MTAISWADSAIADLQAIRAYYREIDPGLAVTVAGRVLSAIETVADHPGIGARTRLRRVRKWRARKTPYLIFYKRTHSGIEVIRVRHSRSDWKGH